MDMLDFATGHRLLLERRLPLDRTAEFHARAATLADPLAAIARRFLASQAAGATEDEQARVAAELGGCDDRQLADIFAVLLPGLACGRGDRSAPASCRPSVLRSPAGPTIPA
jgi:hypothetical protein